MHKGVSQLPKEAKLQHFNYVALYLTCAFILLYSKYNVSLQACDRI